MCIDILSAALHKVTTMIRIYIESWRDLGFTLTEGLGTDIEVMREEGVTRGGWSVYYKR